MKDPFLNDQICIDRLLSDYTVHKNLIIAYDFDNTVYDFHKKGHTFDALIDIIKQCYYLNLTLVCYTAYEDLNFVENYLLRNNIPFNYINQSPVGSHPSKLYFNLLLDDRAGLSAAYNQLKQFIHLITVT